MVPLQVGTQTNLVGKGEAISSQDLLQLISGLVDEVQELRVENAWLRGNVRTMWEGGMESLRWVRHSMACLSAAAFDLAYSSLAGAAAAMEVALGINEP